MPETDRFNNPELATNNPDLVKGDIRDEQYREYDFGGRVYRINDPVALVFRKGGSTHRIVDRYNVVHCVPAPGVNGCVLRWCNRDGADPVAF
jgi:hypothetical protein